MSTRYGLLVSAMLLFSHGPWVAAQVVTARIDRDTISVTDTFQLIVEHSGTQRAAQPDLSPLQNDFEVLGSNQSSQFSMVDGRTTARIQWNLTLAPIAAGAFTIPPIPVGNQQTNPVNIKVLAAGAGNASAKPSALYLEADVVPPDPYVQAQVVYTLKLFHRGQLQEGNLNDPVPENAIVERLGKDIQYETRRDGRSYHVIERRYAILPQASGTLQVPPVLFSGRAAEGSRRNADPFGSILQSSRPVRARAPAMEIEVRGRPDQAPSGPWLPAENLALREQWVPDPPVFRVGEPVTRTVTLLARGLTSAQLPELSTGEQDWVKSYPDQPLTKTSTQGVHIVGRREQKLALVPTQSGTFALPQIRVPWWDTTTDEARVAVLPKRTITVMAPQQVPEQPQDGRKSEAITHPNEEIPASTQTGDVNPSMAHGQGTAWAWKLTAVLFLAGWLSTAFLWRRERMRAATLDVHNRKSSELSGTAAWRQFEKACRNNDAHAARHALLEWAARRWPDEPPRGLSALADRFSSPDARSVVRELDGALYGRDASPWNAGYCLRTLAKEPCEKPRPEKRSARRGALPTLYPSR